MGPGCCSWDRRRRDLRQGARGDPLGISQLQEAGLVCLHWCAADKPQPALAGVLAAHAEWGCAFSRHTTKGSQGTRAVRVLVWPPMSNAASLPHVHGQISRQYPAATCSFAHASIPKLRWAPALKARPAHAGNSGHALEQTGKIPLIVATYCRTA